MNPRDKESVVDEFCPAKKTLVDKKYAPSCALVVATQSGQQNHNQTDELQIGVPAFVLADMASELNLDLIFHEHGDFMRAGKRVKEGGRVPARRRRSVCTQVAWHGDPCWTLLTERQVKQIGSPLAHHHPLMTSRASSPIIMVQEGGSEDGETRGAAMSPVPISDAAGMYVCVECGKAGGQRWNADGGEGEFQVFRGDSVQGPPSPQLLAIGSRARSEQGHGKTNDGSSVHYSGAKLIGGGGIVSAQGRVGVANNVMYMNSESGFPRPPVEHPRYVIVSNSPPMTTQRLRERAAALESLREVQQVSTGAHVSPLFPASHFGLL